MFRVIAGFALALILSAGSAFAQATVAVSGAVRDASGGVLPGATVNVVVADRVVTTATTGDDGRYQAQAPAGVPFSLRVQLEGFAEQAIELAGTTRAVTRDVSLQIGRVSDTLVVTGTGIGNDS